MTDNELRSIGRDVLESVNLKIVHVKIPGTDDVFKISMPADFDRLLDQVEGDPEQNLPYWAEIWPSGIALAAHILKQPEFVRDTRVIELGCGLGVTAIAAKRCGAALVATDYAPDALALCESNCIANGVPAPSLLQVNWRKPDANFFSHVGNGASCLLAADVLYEERDIEPLIEVVEATLSPGGKLWLAEPGRRPSARFLERILALGWSGKSTSYSGPWPDPVDNRKGVIVTVHQIVRPA